MPEKMLVEDFHEKVRMGLRVCGVPLEKKVTLGVAVSGGADSIALLTSLKKVLPEDISLNVITVNHNMRPKEETEGDAAFVESYASSLGLPCCRVDLPPGLVFEYSEKNAVGGEAAARALRYKAFDSFIQEYEIDFLCLAHNQNDQIETLLMRFFQGAGSESLGGIPRIRGKYIRPLLDISRTEIENYLSLLNISYKTDSTNFDTTIFRNKIRRLVIPFLNQTISGWDKAVLSLGQKIAADGKYLSSLAEKAMEGLDFFFDQKEGKISFDALAFDSLDLSIKRRVLYWAYDQLLSESRLQWTFVKEILSKSHENLTFNGCGVSFYKCDGRFFMEKEKKLATQSGFFVIIKGDGDYRAGPWFLSVNKYKNGLKLFIQDENQEVTHSFELENLRFPFAFRSCEPNDCIKTADCRYRGLVKVFADWKCSCFKDKIPLIQELYSPRQELVCILGSPLGFKNWIVKEIK